MGRRGVDLLAAFRDDVARLLDDALASLAPDAERPPLEAPPDRSMGDLGVPCFSLARTLRKAPPVIADEVAAAIAPRLPTGRVAGVRAVGPYVNFVLDRAAVAHEVLADPDEALRAEAKPGRILLEHTSANPNGPLHVGRARNPILGDTLGRILRAAGHDVETQYYMDNLGRQVALLYWGRQNLDPTDFPAPRMDKPDHDLVRYYQAANQRMQEDPAVAAEIKRLVAQLESADPVLLAKVRPVYEACFAGMRASLERLGVTYDSIKDESDLVRDGSVEATIAALQESPRAAREEDGANYLDLSDKLEGNKSTKFFFTRRDGTSVYATRDVAYHRWKADRVGADGRLIDVLGEDHRLQALQVSIALEELGYPRPHVVFYAFVSLPDGKMSTRANRVVFLDDLLEEAVVRAREAVQERRGDELDPATIDAIAEAVGIAAVRFNIARVQPEKPIRFQWEDALSFDGDSAPYLLYAHARAASLLHKAEKEGRAPSVDPAPPGDGEQALLVRVAEAVGAVEDAAARYAPHRFCSYALALATAFNEYYRDHPVLACGDEALRATRLATVDAARRGLRFCLEALGLPVLDAM